MSISKAHVPAPFPLVVVLLVAASMAGCVHDTRPPPCEDYMAVGLESLVESAQEFDQKCVVTNGYNRGLETIQETGRGAHYKYRFSSQSSGDAPIMIVELTNQQAEDSPVVRWEVTGRYHFHSEGRDYRAFFLAADAITRA